MKVALTLLMITIGVMALVDGVALAQNANDLFQQALVKERTEGHPAEAIKLYQTIVQKYGSDRRLAARALFQIGQAYEKLGDSEARKSYERITREFADQKDVVADASRRLAALKDTRLSDKLATRLILSGGFDYAASISPDGRWMSEMELQSGDLAIRDFTTGQLKRLMAKTNGWEMRAFAESPVVSSDLRQIAYAWYPLDGIHPTNQLRVMPNEAGSKARVLISNPEFRIWPMAWSGDGKSLLVRIRKLDSTWQLAWVATNDGSIKVLKSLDWRFRNFGRATLSPDGSYIAYSAAANNPTRPQNAFSPTTDQYIYVLSADGSNEKVLTKTAGVNEFPVWTPDGRHILFTSNRSGSFGLWSIPMKNGAAAGAASLIKADTGQIEAVGVSRVGSYYYTQFKGGWNVFLGDIQAGTGKLTKAATRLTDNFVGSNIEPSWSPDGKFIAFLRQSADDRNNYHLVLYSLEAGDERVYARDRVRRGSLTWFPDGTGLLLDARDTSGAASLHRIDLRTGTLSDVGAEIRAKDPGRRRGSFGALSLDGMTFYKAGSDKEGTRLDRVLAYDVNTWQLRNVVAIPGMPETGDISGLALSPDGRTFAMTIFQTRQGQRGEARLARVATDGADYRELVTFESAANASTRRLLAWTKDGRILFSQHAIDAGTNYSQIMRIASGGGTPEFTGLKMKESVGSIDLSPDGSRMIFADDDGDRELWAIENLSSLLQ